MGDEEDVLLAVFLTLPNAATFCFGLALFFPGIANATEGLSFEDESARFRVDGLGGGEFLAVFVGRAGEELLAGGGVERLEDGDAAEMVSSMILTSGGMGILCTVLTAFQSTTEINLYSEGCGALQQPGHP